MKVSVITAVRNAVDKIEPTIASVLSQDYGNIEYIVVDGASTDGTLDVVKAHAGKIHSWTSEPDGGMYDALNKGIGLATGEWIGILNAGDVFSSNSVISDMFARDDFSADCDVLYGDAISNDNGVLTLQRASEDVDIFCKAPPYRHGASFVKARTHKRFLFDMSKKAVLGFALDYEQMYRMYKAGARFMHVPVAVVTYELRGISTVSPFKITYCNYLITHGMRCSFAMRIVLAWLTLWRGGVCTLQRAVRRVASGTMQKGALK